MDRATLDRLRARGYEFDSRYDELADIQTKNQKKAGDEAQILNIQVKPDPQNKQDNNQYFIVRVALSSGFYTNLVLIEIDGKTFQAFKKGTISEQFAFYAQVYVDFSSIVREEETFTLTAKLKNFNNKITDTKTVNVKVDDSGNVGETKENTSVSVPTENNDGNIDFTFEDISEVWEDASKEKVQSIVDELNETYNVDGKSKKLYEIFEINTSLRRCHFFAQAFVESGAGLKGAFEGESLNYSVKALKSGIPFKVFLKEPYKSEADSIGRKESINKMTKKKTITQIADQKAIANIAYADKNRSKNYKLGNIEEGDGWNFRGRGLLQITGRSNYKDIQEIINKKIPTSSVDLGSGKEIFTAKEAVFAGLGDWVFRKSAKSADNGSEEKNVDEITALINKSTKSYKVRSDAFKRLKKIFNID